MVKATPIGIGLSVDIVGNFEGVEKMLYVLSIALNPIAIAVFFQEDVTPYLVTRAKQRFDSEGDDVSGPWAPLKYPTQAARAAGRAQGRWTVGDEHPINVRTHELENYITSGNAATLPTPYGARLSYPRASGKPTIRQKMKVAQKGEGRTPPRPVLGLNERDALFINTALAIHIRNAGRSLGVGL